MNTEITYMYTCASNWKDSMPVIISGEFSEKEKEQILSQIGDKCDGGFIPYKMDLPHLSAVLGDTEDDMQAAIDFAEDKESKVSIKMYDHPWHRITGIKSTSEAADTTHSTVSFLAKLKELKFIK